MGKGASKGANREAGTLGTLGTLEGGKGAKGAKGATVPGTGEMAPLTPWSSGTPPLNAVPARHQPPAAPPWVMARYKDRPEKHAQVVADGEAWRRLTCMASEPSIYANRPTPRARDSFEVGVLLWQIEGAMRSLERRR